MLYRNTLIWVNKILFWTKNLVQGLLREKNTESLQSGFNLLKMELINF